MKQIKVIDLFAGPGGLGEGFSSLKIKGKYPFKIAVSVEKEASAHATLMLRAFVREFPDRKPPKEYYQYVSGAIDKDQLFKSYPKEYAAAQKETLYEPTELGKDNKKIHSVIEGAIGDCKNWVLIGGPPCQAYSLVGRARNKGKEGYSPAEDHRHFLYKEYLNVLTRFRPPVFVMENVKGILSSRIDGVPIFRQILEDLREAGYVIYSFAHKPKEYGLFGSDYDSHDFVIRTEDYGVPQARHRVILLGVRNDFTIEAENILLTQSPKVGVKKVIGRLPKLRSGISKDEDSDEAWLNLLQRISNTLISKIDDKKIKAAIQRSLKNRTQFRKGRGAGYIAAENTLKDVPAELAEFYRDQNLHGVINHDTRSHIEQDIARYLYAAAFAKVYKVSARLADFPAQLQPKHANRETGKFVDRFKVQLSHQPASTVTSHISKDGHYFIHYDTEQCRSLTVREAARIQTFPDNYFFEGNRTQQYVQVGNAVPPFLANKIASRVLNLLC